MSYLAAVKAVSDTVGDMPSLLWQFDATMLEIDSEQCAIDAAGVLAPHECGKQPKPVRLCDNLTGVECALVLFGTRAVFPVCHGLCLTRHAH